jgi:hypothetical protein
VWVCGLAGTYFQCGVVGVQKILTPMPGFEPKLAKLLSNMKQTNFSALLTSDG